MKVMLGGPVLTQDERGTVAEAIAWDQGRIVAVGSEEVVLARAGADAERLELDGAAVVPGFIDAHHHLGLTTLYSRAVECGPTAAPDLSDLFSALTRAAAELDRDQWVVGAWFNERLVAERRLPTLAELDQAVPDHPLVLLHYSFHACLTNSKGLAALGLGRSTADPPGGRIGRDWRGRLNGLLYETAMSPAELVAEEALLEREGDHFAGDLADSARRLFEAGVTRLADATVSPRFEAIYQDLHERGQLPIPLVMMPVGARGYLRLPSDRLDGRVTGEGTDTLRFGPLKLLADGGDEMAVGLDLRSLPGVARHLIRLLSSPGGVAALGEMNRFTLRLGRDLRLHAGLRLLTGEAARRLTRDAVDRGFSLAIHAMGNEAIDDALDLISGVRIWHRGDPPPRIEHFFIASEEHLRRAADLGVQLVCQPEFLSLTKGMASPLPGLEFLPLRRALDLGVKVAGSSDHPVVNFQPLSAMRSAVWRRWGTDAPVHPDQAITVEEVLVAYTREAARACGCLETCGTIEEGKRADLVVLSTDPRGLEGEAIEHLEVQWTFLGGEWVASSTARV